jgi:hypothetical protein
VAGGDTVMVALGVSHQRPFVRNRKRYVQVPRGLLTVPL